MKTYTNGLLRVVVEAGRVVESNTEHCPVGAKPNMDFIRRAGLRLVKKPVKVDVWGRKIG
jgi:hypothetical protein